MATPEEMSLKNVNCLRRATKTCQSNGTDDRTSRVFTTDSIPNPNEDLCFCVLLSDDVSHPPRTSVTGSTYKVNIVVKGFKTRALLDNGSQVSLVRAKMLSKIE